MLADYSFEFIANNNIGSGTLYAINTLNNEQVSLQISVFGDFTLEGHSYDAYYCNIDLYDIVDGNETFISSTFINSEGYFSFIGVNVEKFKIVVNALSNNIIVYSELYSDGASGTVWSNDKYSSSFCSDNINEITNKFWYPLDILNWTDINSIISVLEKGYNIFPNLPKKIKSFI